MMMYGGVWKLSVMKYVQFLKNLNRNQLMRIKIFSFVLATALLPASVYAGCVQGDCRNGTGKMESPDGRVYQGGFKNGFLWGRGVLVYPDGMRYEGEFVKGRFNGRGVLTSPDGRRY
jgi:hypothetical protein